MIPFNRNIRLVLFALMVFSLLPLSSAAGDKVEVKSIRCIQELGHLRVVVDLSGSVEFIKGNLSNPDRLFIDLKGSVLSKGITKSLSFSDGILKSVRLGQFSADTARIVLEFNNSDKPERLEVSKADSPDRLVIDLFGRGSSALGRIQTIVIDAGHGGHDPGAIGKNRLREKDVTLDIALKLKEMLKADPRYKVFLTRDRDVFLGLRQRAEMANRKSADLFISIHANANPNRDARGIETYLLNWTDDEEAMKVAARENAISVRKMKESRSELGLILASLELQSKRDESLKLAHSIQGSIITGLESGYSDVVNLGVKQALFYVLVGAKMPSVLVEVSFVSNPSEEKLLKKDGYRKYLARGIAEGIEKYLKLTQPAEGEKVAVIRK